MGTTVATAKKVAVKTPHVQIGVKNEKSSELPTIDRDADNHDHVDYEIVFAKTVPFTKQLAKEFMSMREFIGERPVMNSHVDFLLGHMRNGTFLMTEAGLADCFCAYDGQIRRLNGHHTSYARQMLDDDNWTPDIRHVRYKVNSETDFRKLYSLFDRNRARSNVHIVKARLYNSTQFPNLTQKAIVMTKNGLTHWLYGNDHTSRKKSTVDDIIHGMIHDHHALCTKISNFLNDVSVNEHHIQRASVVGAMFATFSKSEQDAKEFWSMVRTGLDCKANDPRKTLRDYLQAKRVMTSGCNIGVNKTNSVPAETMYRACIFAWNAWRKGEELKQILVRDSEKPRPSVR